MWSFGDPQSTSVIPIFLNKSNPTMSVLQKEMRFLILNRVAKRMFFGLNRMAVHPYPNNPAGFLPYPLPPLPTPLLRATANLF